MLRAIIVDDEPYVRQMIKGMIPWQQMDMELAGEFYNGEDAYQFIEQHSGIDVAFTDLRMPVMDGLHLIRRALEVRPGLNFIVVSAYDDFHLVKDAFMLGAKDYLLKSEMTEQQIRHVLSRLQEKAAANSGGLSEGPEKGSAYDGQYWLKETLLSRLAAGHISAADIGTLQSLLSGHAPKKWRSMMVKLHKPNGQAAPPAGSFAAEITRYVMEQEEALACREQMRCDIAAVSPYEYMLVLQYAVHEAEAAMNSHMTELSSRLKLEGLCASIGISRTSADFAKLPALAEEARLCAAYCFIAGNGSIIRYTPQLAEPSPMEINAAGRTAQLKKLLNTLWLEQGKAADLTGIAISPSSVCVRHIQAVADLYMKYHFVLVDFAQQNGLFTGATAALSAEYEQHWKHNGDLHSLNQWLASFIHALQTYRGEHSIIHQIKLYMASHYTDDISLQSVAGKFNINSSYLSRLFSEKENASFVDYLSHIRISKAMELMKTSHFKIYEICEKVGYTSPEHFSRTFKKMTGKSPKQFMDGRS
ncbi:response regulator transcription factor [Paenibacillus protaetiae]|uniref:Response regulator n=1 Tax=Paenibacillus protaetiae TaxID=2509456 RepID=A0A4P6EVB8_9BACL|nr:helix-turn-helix domain-containing protein [Paenibacillus protaetiae]QAY66972.1 response regulator [Paenibacillus protaetiae]